MATENLREKINVLNNMIQADDLQSFQTQLQIDAAKTTSGDAQVDQAMKAQAENAKAQILACARRLETYRAKHAELSAELNSTNATT